MEIANPIYDAAFKYLMQDDRAARLVIGRIAGLAVESVEFRPQEVAVSRPDGQGGAGTPPLTLMRMDFAARVRTAGGDQQQVLIEIQKAKTPTVIERFRRYLGEQFASSDNLAVGPSGAVEAVPIVTIYLLGYDLGLSEEAVLDICPRTTERRTGRVLSAGHPFVEGIHHRSHVVQIPRLKSRRRDDLERFLSVFDQGLITPGRSDNYALSLEESEYPAEAAPVLRQLRRAIAEDDVRREMRGEDLLLRDSLLLTEQVARLEREAAEEARRAQQEAERAEQATGRAEHQAERADQEAERADQEAERADQEAERADRLLLQSVRHLNRLRHDAGQIAAALSVDIEDVRRVLGDDVGQ